MKPTGSDRGSIVSKENVPGPGAYQITGVDKKRQPQFTLKFRSEFETKKLQVPGPGLYSPLILNKQKPVSIGKSQRSNLGAAPS